MSDELSQAIADLEGATEAAVRADAEINAARMDLERARSQASAARNRLRALYPKEITSEAAGETT